MRRPGFTLAELLIALVILGVIATFTIPKVLSSQADSRRRAVVKETAGMLSGAWQAYKQQNTITGSLGIPNLTPYMNFVSFTASGTQGFDAWQGSPSATCSAAYPCLLLHNGALVNYGVAENLGGTDSTSAVWVDIDPTAGASGANSPEGQVEFWMYANGRIASIGTVASNTCCCSGYCISADPSKDPSWWGWN